MAELRVKSTGTLKLFENDNTSSVTIASPASLGADRTVTLPDGDVTLLTGWSTDSGTNDSLVPASASAGIYLGVAAATAANLLDDYEEGTWTPAWNTGDNGLTIGGTGSYTKIGNTVNLRGHFTIDSSGTGSGDVSFSGLPLTSVNTGGYRASVSSYWSHLAVACTDICGFIQTNSVLVYFREGGTTGDGNDLGNHIDQDSHFFFSATYQAA